MSDLDEQIRSYIDGTSAPLSTDEVLEQTAAIGADLGRAETQLDNSLVPEQGQVAGRIGPLAVKAAHCERHLSQAAHDALHIFSQHQSGQVHEYRHPQSRARIGRTGGQISQTFGVGVVQGFCDIGDDAKRDGGGDTLSRPSEALEMARKGNSADSLHRDVVAAVDQAVFIDMGDVRMA